MRDDSETSFNGMRGTKTRKKIAAGSIYRRDGQILFFDFSDTSPSLKLRVWLFVFRGFLMPMHTDILLQSSMIAEQFMAIRAQ